ncbi:hypothetical protein CIHG_05072 [Coccidioides immitis H538.4]|uniref:Transcription initiation factor TFIID subunit 13 n=1 Tax=Coccidioides immitis H538.4 TaxID=396776 RepID=A0A0J8RQQ3_COCIT|nr:hypothetical protein CIHG_05072 [Coccidioides immitis H538.4]
MLPITNTLSILLLLLLQQETGFRFPKLPSLSPSNTATIRTRSFLLPDSTSTIPSHLLNSEETAEQDLAAAAVQASGMSEPRVRLTRHHAQLNFGNELRQLLRAFGDNAPHPDFPQEPNPETVRVLDEIVTDFIIETCHAAAQVAAHAGRQKVKVDDFMFVIRRDAAKLGRVQELFQLEKELKEARKAFDQNDDRVGKDATAGKEIEGLVGSDGEGAETVVDGTSAAAGKKKGKGKKRAAGMETAASESGAGKKRKVSTVKAESTA